MEKTNKISCSSTIEANILKAKLESEGIECYILNENFNSLYPNMVNILGANVELLVSSNDFARVQSIINGTKQIQIEKCPECGSNDIGFSLGERKFGKIITIIISLFLFIPFSNIKVKKYCKNCGELLD